MRKQLKRLARFIRRRDFMPQRQRQEPTEDVNTVFQRLSESGPGAPSLMDQFALVARTRERMPELSAALDRWLLSQLRDLRRGLAEAQVQQERLRQLHDNLTSPPWYAAVFLRGDAASSRAVVSYQNTPRVVALVEGLDIDTLKTGDDVLLTHDLNLILQKLTPSATRACEVGEFQQLLADGRLVLKTRDAEIVVHAAEMLEAATLTRGDRLRWDSGLAMAFERLPRPAGSSFFLSETPSDRFSDVGGLDAEIEQLQRAIRLHMRHPEIVARYGLMRVGSALLVGPPGTGKTMLARALAHWLAEETGGRSRFLYVKPGALHSLWFGQSEWNYREVFRAAREAGAADPRVPVVLFFDEIDSIGTTRGVYGGQHVDARVLTSLMAELDGLDPRGNVFVVSATNRRDALDPALLRPGRLGDLILEVRRPTMSGARAILERHFSTSAPYASDLNTTDARRDVIDTAVSQLYAPNGSGDIAVITFRDGTRRPVLPRDLVSGAMLAGIARRATERACVRDLEYGDAGIRRSDVLDAIVDEVTAAVSALAPHNCHTHIAGLPQDLAAVRVEPTLPTPRRPHRFLGVA
jgi:proteasome-associated ATPase